MSTISAILTPAPDGTVHLPLPEGWREQSGRVRVVAQVEWVGAGEAAKGTKREPGSLKGFRMSPDFDEPLEDFKEYMG